MVYNNAMKRYIMIIIICAAAILLISVPCPFYGIFGIPCLTCGITRAYKLFLSGHIRDAFLMHPLFLLPPLLLIPVHRKKQVIIGMLVLFICVYAVRFYMLFPSTPPFKYNTDCVMELLNEKVVKNYEYK